MKKYLVCIDSDGCAIDSMEIKHRRCFGPGIVEIWKLDTWREQILTRWNEINLYSMTRGINRFLGLERMLTEINEAYTKIGGLKEYSSWCQNTDQFSNAAVEKEIQAGNHEIFPRVLEWSRWVNRQIESIADEIRPFSSVKKVMEAIDNVADIAIVSSANPQAVQSEWSRFGFLPYVDYMMAQDAGTKADCIAKMIAVGYEKNRILVLGDAPGDERAAAANGVWYYPILAGHENESWEELEKEALPKLIAAGYNAEYQQTLLERFHKNLGGAW